MKELQKEVVNATLNSRDVATMMEIEHKTLLRKLEGDKTHAGIIPVLSTQRQMVLSEYYIVSSYKDGSGKENKCYNITKKGCEMLAHKMTGEKGIIFTAKYIERFHDMENYIKSNGSHPVVTTNQELAVVLNGLETKFEEIFDKLDTKIKDIDDKVKDLAEQGRRNHRPSHKTKLDLYQIIKERTNCHEDAELIKKAVFSQFDVSKWEDIPYSDESDILAYIIAITDKVKAYEQVTFFDKVQ